MCTGRSARLGPSLILVAEKKWEPKRRRSSFVIVSCFQTLFWVLLEGAGRITMDDRKKKESSVGKYMFFADRKWKCEREDTVWLHWGWCESLKDDLSKNATMMDKT